MNLDQARKICNPYGIGVEIADPFFNLYGSISHVAFQLRDAEMGCGFAFIIKEGTSVDELENIALAWCINNSFEPSTRRTISETL